MASFGVRLMRPKHEIVGVCGRCGLGVYIDDEICRICEGCGKLTVWCECEELPLEEVTLSEKMARGVFVGGEGLDAEDANVRVGNMVNGLQLKRLVINAFMFTLQITKRHCLSTPLFMH